MSKIAIITDTDSSLPPYLADRYHIRQVPINLHFGEETFRACVDINDEQLFERVDREGVYPTSSAPSIGQFSAAYQDALDAGAEEIVCLCVSGEVSATYDAAVQACDLFPGREIMVMDTRSLSMGQGFMVLTAASAVEEGASVEEVVSQVKAVSERVYLYAALSTLKYLAMSGRVPSLQAGVANLLNVKPILTLKEGKLDLLERVRTRKKAWQRVIELSEGAVGDRSIEEMAIIHINARSEAEEFEGLLRDHLACPDQIIVAELTPGLSLHGGSGLMGVTLVTGS